MKIVTRNCEEDKPPTPTPESVSTKTTPTEQQSIPPPTEKSHFKSTVPTSIEKTTELDSESDSDDNDETFLTGDGLAEDVEKDPAMLSYKNYAGLEASSEDKNELTSERLSRKRKYADIEINSSSLNSPSLDHLNDSIEPSDDEEEREEEEEEEGEDGGDSDDRCSVRMICFLFFVRLSMFITAFYM